MATGESNTLIITTSTTPKIDDPLQPLPPLPPTTTSTAIRHFISSTSRFMNEFVITADERLETIRRRIDDTEVQLSLLEAKLASVPGLTDDDDEEDDNKKEIKSDVVVEGRVGAIVETTTLVGGVVGTDVQ